MENNTNQLFIFKTNIKDLCPHCAVQRTLDRHSEIQQWSFDPDDIDRVLRIFTATLTKEKIITLINQLGHECQELN